MEVDETDPTKWKWTKSTPLIVQLPASHDLAEGCHAHLDHYPHKCEDNHLITLNRPGN